MKKSNDYWTKRKRARMDEYHKDNDKVIGKVLEAYQDSINDIDEQMRNILKTFTASNKMTLEEAKKYLTIGESKDFIENLKKTIDHIQDEDLKAEMLRQINTPAYRARLTRLQAMKEKLNIECKKLADIQVREIEKGLINTANTAYYKTIFDMQQLTGIGFSFAEIPTKRIDEILKNNWSGKHYSKRIWKNTNVLASELEHTLTKGFMTGASVDRMVKEISDKMQVGEFAATRLIRTETTYVANSAELAAYKEAGVEKIMFLATLDLRTSDICRQHDKKIITVNKAIPGENIPPLHANCRSTTLEVLEDDNLAELQRRARDPVTGKNKTVPASMNYSEWYKENVTNNPKAIVVEKKIKNRASDEKQHIRYRKVLGDEVPKHIDDFQNLKYNKLEEWEKIKTSFKDQSLINSLKELNIDVAEKIDSDYFIVNNYKPKITEVSNHAKDNLSAKLDRKDMTDEKAQEFIDNAKLVIYDSKRKTVKFMHDNGYAVLNLNNKLVTSVPQKWRKKYDKYLKEE